MPSVTLVEYQNSWPLQFEEVAAAIAHIFAATPVRIEHIGSTSVPDLCAKPVLDILLGVEDLDAAKSRVADLAALGYKYKYRPEYEVEIPNGRYFVRAEGTQLRVHLHAVLQDGELWLKHIAFRDALRTNPELAREYATLKTRLAILYRDNNATYTEAKAPFITGVLIKLVAHAAPEGVTHGNVQLGASIDCALASFQRM